MVILIKYHFYFPNHEIKNGFKKACLGLVSSLVNIFINYMIKNLSSFNLIVIMNKLISSYLFENYYLLKFKTSMLFQLWLKQTTVLIKLYTTNNHWYNLLQSLYNNFLISIL